MNAEDPANTRRRCRARNRQGNQCGRYPAPGAVVCKLHGAAAPQVQRTARQRLLEAADPAAAALVELLASGDERIRMQAATALLDRAGHGPGVKIADERSEAEVDREIEQLIADRRKAAG